MSSNSKNDEEKSASFRKWNIHDYNRMIASMTSGFIQSLAGHPIDSIKVRMQTWEESVKPNFWRAVKDMYVKEGLKAFGRGAFPPAFGKMFAYCIFFTTNGYFKDLLIEYRRKQRGLSMDETVILSLTDTTLVGVFCGVILAPIVAPAELIKVQLQTDRDVGGSVFGRKYSNMFDCTRIAIQRRAIMRGYVATMLRLAPAWGVYLLTYDAFNRWFDDEGTLGANNTLSSVSTSARVVLAGGLAGVVSWIVSYPPDYVKTQIQAYPITKWNYVHSKLKTTKPPRIRDVVEITFAKYGVRGFFRGLTPCLIRAMPANITNFWVYESVLQYRERFYTD